MAIKMLQWNWALTSKNPSSKLLFNLYTLHTTSLATQSICAFVSASAHNTSFRKCHFTYKSMDAGHWTDWSCTPYCRLQSKNCRKSWTFLGKSAFFRWECLCYNWARLILAVPSITCLPRHEDTDASQQRPLSGTKTGAKHAKLTRTNVQVEKITETGICPVRESKATGQMQILTEGINRCTRFTGKEHEASTMLLQNGIMHREVGGSAFVTLERFKLEANIR